MDSNDGRPIGVPRMSTDYETWLAHYNTPEEIQKAVANCRSWILSCEMQTNPLDRVRRAEHWRERLRLLRTKALIMGITLGE